MCLRAWKKCVYLFTTANMYTNMSKYSIYSQRGSLTLLFIHNSDRVLFVVILLLLLLLLVHLYWEVDACMSLIACISEWDEVIIWAQQDFTQRSTYRLLYLRTYDEDWCNALAYIEKEIVQRNVRLSSVCTMRIHILKFHVGTQCWCTYITQIEKVINIPP